MRESQGAEWIRPSSTTKFTPSDPPPLRGAPASSGGGSSPNAPGADGGTLPPTGSYRGIEYSVREEALDGEHPFPAGGVERAVDANASLVVRFTDSEGSGDGKGDPAVAARRRREWETVTRALDQVKALAAEVARLDEIVTTSDDAEYLRRLRPQATKVGRQVVEFRTAFRSLLEELRGFDLPNIRSIENGTWDGSPSNTDVFTNIARWLQKEIERLESEGNAWTDNLARILVSVEAYHLPVGGQKRAIHVDGYDTIPAGEYRPIDRLGLAMTEAEKRHLEVEVQYSRSAAAALRELRKHKDDLKAVVEDLASRFRRAIRALRAEVEKLDTDPQAGLKKLETAAKAAVAGDAAATQRVEDAVGGLRRIVEAGLALRQAVDQALSGLDRMSGGDPIAALISGPDLLGALKGVLDAAGKLLTALNDVDVGATVRVLVDVFEQNNLQDEKSLAEALQSAIESLDRNRLTATSQFVQETIQIWQHAKAVGTLAETDDPRIFRPANELVDARVVLPTAGVVQGDRVEVRVRFFERETAQGVSRGRLFFERSHYGRIVLVGMHRKFSGELIFARAVSGSADAREWKPNVAAAVNWYYFVRDPEGCETFWNWLSPGFGIHVASLDQGDQNVEVGVGGNLVFWDGLLTVGGGYNLSASDDNEYLYIGIGLIEALQKAKQGLTKTGLLTR